MKTLYLVITFIFFISCRLQKENSNKTVLGNISSQVTWLYLCGLTENFKSSFEKNNRCLLDKIGKNINVKIIAIKPKDRCFNYNDMLCWPHNNKREILETYQYITKVINSENVTGYIGFSNGGFFLLKLAEIKNLKVPIIAIGASGFIEKVKTKNKIILLIGKLDKYHYDSAKQFYKQAKETSLDIKLIEYNKGHVVPTQLLQQIIQDESTKSMQ